MASLFIVNVPEYEPMWKCAVGDGDLEIREVGAWIELRFARAVTIDRVKSGVRHAVWYSGVGAIQNARVVQFDKHALRVEAL